ncbi:hypothetical protein D9M71_834360 [compost metagenome]
MALVTVAIVPMFVSRFFGARRGFLRMPVAIVGAMLGGRLVGTGIPRQAAKSERCHGGNRQRDLAFVIHCYSC